MTKTRTSSTTTTTRSIAIRSRIMRMLTFHREAGGTLYTGLENGACAITTGRPCWTWIGPSSWAASASP